MTMFSFQAKTIQGKVVKGSLEAESEVEARVKLRAQHLIPFKLNTATQKTHFDLSFLGKMLKSKSVPPKEMQAMTRQFSTLIDAGIPILQSISILEQTVKNRNLKNGLANVSDRIENGE